MTLRQLATHCLLLLVPSAVVLATPQLSYVATRILPEGTHRPEILALPGGRVMVVVVQPEGQQGIGPVKHKAYRFDAGWNLIGEPFVVTRITEKFGEPADHRAAIVNGELVVIYQSLIFRSMAPQTGPAESAAREQSLMLSRFTLAGQELDRRPIVAHATDFSQDNFPDFCILWRNGRFLVDAGSTSRTLKIHEVDLQGVVLTTRVLQASPFGMGGTLGNSLLQDGYRLFVFSATGPESGDLTLTEMDESLLAVSTLRLSDPAREQNFPTGNLLDSGSVFVAYRSGNRLLVSWSKSLNRGDHPAPQVQIEEFELPDPAGQ